MLIGVDLDHTLVHIDKPLPGAKEAMQKLKELGHNILIHSCNNVGWIKKVLNDNDIPYDYIWGSEHDLGKPVCAAYIDDKAVAFRGDWEQSLKDVEALVEQASKPWGSK